MNPSLPAPAAWAVLLLTGAVLLPLLALALHRLHLLVVARRGARAARDGARTAWDGKPGTRTGGTRKVGEGAWCVRDHAGAEDPPFVTVQIPVYNEAAVVERALDAAARLDHPRDRIEIQLLDDSTDATRERAARRIAWWRARGVRIEHLHRRDRAGFKAGALQAGLERARGELILVLDADFVPPPGLLGELLPPFADPRVGMVQARWDHLNEEARPLTRCQALLLDAHFFFEQGGRHAAGRFINFNGTAGIWRREALEEAGGWSWDTLTEDLDVSYRAQMAGWRFVFLPDVGVPAEIPERTRALEVQQKRWAQGGVQTARKLLPALLRGPWSAGVKVEAVAHLLAHLAHPLTLLLGLLLLPSAVAREALGLERFLALDLVVFAGATLSFLLFYTAAGLERGRPLARLLPRAVATLVLGLGLTAPVSRAVVRGLLGGRGDPFLRTPKRGDGSASYRSPVGTGDRILEGALLLWMVGSGVAAVAWGYFASLPFLVLFGAGYAWLLVGGLAEELRGRGVGSSPAEVRCPPARAPAPARRATRTAVGGAG